MHFISFRLILFHSMEIEIKCQRSQQIIIHVYSAYRQIANQK